MTTRRDFLRRAGFLSAATAAAATGVSAPIAEALAGTVHPDPRSAAASDRPPFPAGSPEEVARDERYWAGIARQYRTTDRIVNLEAGYFGMMADPVLEAYHGNIDRVNRESSWFARSHFPRMAGEARERTAVALGVAPDEIVFLRNATEALQTLIGGYAGVGAGDVVMYADLDYAAMQDAMRGLAARRGARVVVLDLPEPATREGILATYAAALDAHPRTRLLLLTHTNNKTGLIHPVREIHDLARERGVEVIVDAAHSFGQMPLSLPDLGAPYAGVNLHKWVGAPVGVAAMYIRRDALRGIDPAPGHAGSASRIDDRVHTGTTDFATLMTVPAALDFQESIGLDRKGARLRHLRDSWVLPARGIEGVDILTPDDPGLVGALTGFRIGGDGSREGVGAVVRTLEEEFGIFTVARTGIAGGDCVRVTVALYNSRADTARLVDALRIIAGSRG